MARAVRVPTDMHHNRSPLAPLLVSLLASACATGMDPDDPDGAGGKADDASSQAITSAHTEVEFTSKTAGLLTVTVTAAQFTGSNPTQQIRWTGLRLGIDGPADAVGYEESSNGQVYPSGAGPLELTRELTDQTAPCRDAAEEGPTSTITQADIDRCWTDPNGRIAWSDLEPIVLELKVHVLADEVAHIVVDQDHLLSPDASLSYRFQANSNLPVDERLVVPHHLEPGEHLRGVLGFAVSAESFDFRPGSAEENSYSYVHVFPFTATGPALLDFNGCFVARGQGQATPTTYISRGSYIDDPDNGVENNFLTQWIPEAGEYNLLCPAKQAHMPVEEILDLQPLTGNRVRCQQVPAALPREPNSTYVPHPQSPGTLTVCPGTLQCAPYDHPNAEYCI